ncbi:MAG: beta-propeller domain-containing protein [Candidatus Aenigmarchaeota archaeon]|nr:beta-propeller domain-containing protein [Candidatus Aenigmarchaeota archaeon]
MNRKRGETSKGNFQLSLAVLIIIAIVFVSGCAVGPKPPTSGVSKVELSSLKKFSSLEEVKSFIGNNTAGRGYYDGNLFEQTTLVKSTALPATAIQEGDTAQTPDYSETNVQVRGVDEADIVKTDGKYIYTISGSNKIVIVEAYPVDGAKALSTIEINGTVSEMFVNKDRLVVFGRENIERPVYASSMVIDDRYYPRYQSKEFVRVYDITDRANPSVKKNIELNGSYFDSRMIGNRVYFVVNSRVWDDNVILPMDRKTGDAEIYYFDEPANSYMFTLVGALNLDDINSEPETKTFLLANTEDMFVSLDNIYITHQKQVSNKESLNVLVKVLVDILPQDVAAKITEIGKSGKDYYKTSLDIINVLYNYTKDLSREENQAYGKKFAEKVMDLGKDLEKTVVYKISISGGEIKAVAKGEFPGHVLNQFSMDEFNGYFRTASTTGDVRSKTSKNHVYVLGDDGSGNLNVIGKVEDLAPGEKIYSARFLGERAYVVTFKKVDPLFVIDLKDPANPKLLGKLKIPGYSDYLHPYDENHIIGIGKNTIEASEELKDQRDLDFAWYQGVKLALFDVTDPENPKEMSKFLIGDRGTESLALEDHKAFLFSKEKNLLVIPVLLAEIKDKTEEPVDRFGPQYGDYTFQGAYVFELTLDKGFVLKGRITHVVDQESFKKSGYYYYGAGDAVQRSLYIGEILYTISDRFVKANSLADLSEVKSVDISEKNITRMTYEERLEYCPKLCGDLYSHNPCANDCMAGVESQYTKKS